MYGEAQAEEIVGEAIAGRRERCVSWSARCFRTTRAGAGPSPRASAASSAWRPRTSTFICCIGAATCRCARRWRRSRHFGPTAEFARGAYPTSIARTWRSCWRSRAAISAQPIKCSITSAARGVEWDLAPFCRQRGIALMAYSPVDQGRLLRDRRLQAIAKRCGVTPATLAIAWLLAQPNVAVIPKAVNQDHVRDNLLAANWVIPPTVRAELERAFPAPTGAEPLAML